MRRVNFNDEKFQEVTVKGISCMFSDGRIDRDTVPGMTQNLSLVLIRFLLMRRLWLIYIRDMRFTTGMESRFILRWQKVLQVG